MGLVRISPGADSGFGKGDSSDGLWEQKSPGEVHGQSHGRKIFCRYSDVL